MGKVDIREFTEVTALPSLDSFIPTWFVCGKNCTAIITEDKSLHVIGETYSDEIAKMPIDRPVLLVACGWNSLVCIPEGGGIYYCFDGDQDLQFAHGDVTFVDCAAGMMQFVALSDDGRIFTWGEGISCAHGNDFYSSTPSIVSFESTISFHRVFATNYVTFLLDNDNGLWVSGFNDGGMAGLGPLEETDEFVRIPQFTRDRITLIAGGRDMTYALTQAGEVFACGVGEDQKLMLDDDSDVLEFTKCSLTEGKFVSHLASGNQHVLLSLGTGELMQRPVLKRTTQRESATPIESAASRCCILL
jgi:alpha-tubulin suppressor-like RCC1 family protein